MAEVRVEDKGALTASAIALNDLLAIITAAGLVKNIELSELIKKILGGDITPGTALPSAAVILDASGAIVSVGGIRMKSTYSPSNVMDIATKKYIDTTRLNDDYPVLIKKKTVEYSDLTSGVAYNILTVEAGTLILGIDIYVKTGFTDSGTDLMDVGITSDVDYFKAAIDVSSTGWKVIDDATYPYRASAEGITITYTGGSVDADAGSVEVYIRYVKF